MNELPVSPAAKRDKKSLEMIRAWIAENRMHCSLNVGVWEGAGEMDEQQAWGILLADITRHVANALEESTGIDYQKSLKRIAFYYNEELADPTSDATGSYLDE